MEVALCVAATVSVLIGPLGRRPRLRGAAGQLVVGTWPLALARAASLLRTPTDAVQVAQVVFLLGALGFIVLLQILTRPTIARMRREARDRETGRR